MENIVDSFIERHKLLNKNATVLVGVSGGPDSMALLHYLSRKTTQWGLRLIALSIDHGLRGPESQKDVAYVEEMCKLWNIEFRGTTLNVPLYKEKENLGTQVAARELRYQFFEEQMEVFGADYLVLGHHGDDQVETMLMRIVNRTTPSAIAGIPVKRKFRQGSIVRPLLCVTKEMTEDYCKRHGIHPRRDPSNQEDIYTRNYFRRHILPLVKEQNPNLHRSMQKLSETFFDDETYLRNEAQKLVNSVVEFEAQKAQFEIEAFKSYPIALQRRAFHLILNYLFSRIPKNLFYVHAEQFFDLIQSPKANVVVDLPSGLKMAKNYQKINFYFTQTYVYPYQSELEIPGETYLPDGSIITASLHDSSIKNSEYTYTCDIEDSRLPLKVRTRESGDRMSIYGLNGSKKVKDIFIDEKIPLYQRDTWPIVTDNNGKILWLIGLRKANSGRRGNNTRFLQLHYQKSGNQ